MKPHLVKPPWKELYLALSPGHSHFTCKKIETGVGKRLGGSNEKTNAKSIRIDLIKGLSTVDNPLIS